MVACYNDNEPYVAQWLRNLVSAGLLPAGDVDERSIVDVHPDDLRGYSQCHFFAGIGGWPLALQLAGWGDGEVWTGSCPCQPLSCAGQRKGHADERHLWPAFYRLVAECQPATIFGEQVAGKDGREWLAAARHDLETAGYAVGSVNLPACAVGAQHERQRHYFVAHALRPRLSQRRKVGTVNEDEGDIAARVGPPIVSSSLPDSHDKGESIFSIDAEVGSASKLIADAYGITMGRPPESWRECFEWTHQPVLGGSVHGIPRRMGQLRAYGNAIVPPLAAEFIRAAREAISEYRKAWETAAP